MWNNTMRYKTICFECREHSNYNKLGLCYRCNSNMIINTGPALRLPKKNNISAWKTLTEIYLLQYRSCKEVKMTYMRGFRNNALLHDCQYKQGMSMKQKEKATLEVLKTMPY